MRVRLPARSLTARADAGPTLQVGSPRRGLDYCSCPGVAFDVACRTWLTVATGPTAPHSNCLRTCTQALCCCRPCVSARGEEETHSVTFSFSRIPACASGERRHCPLPPPSSPRDIIIIQRVIAAGASVNDAGVDSFGTMYLPLRASRSQLRGVGPPRSSRC